MDILSDVNVVGNITTNSLTTGILRSPTSPLSIFCKNGNKYADVQVFTLYSRKVNASFITSGNTSSTTLSAETLQVGSNGGMLLDVSNNRSWFCKQVLFNCDVAAAYDNKPDVDYFTKKRNVRMIVPSDCTLFKILEEEQNFEQNDSETNTIYPYPLVQAFDNSTKKTITMDYKFVFCVESGCEGCTYCKAFVSVFGEKSSGTTATDFTFGVLLEQRYKN